jgi:hypothetical protein
METAADGEEEEAAAEEEEVSALSRPAVSARAGAAAKSAMVSGCGTRAKNSFALLTTPHHTTQRHQPNTTFTA